MQLAHATATAAGGCYGRHLGSMTSYLNDGIGFFEQHLPNNNKMRAVPGPKVTINRKL